MTYRPSRWDGGAAVSEMYVTRSIKQEDGDSDILQCDVLSFIVLLGPIENFQTKSNIGYMF